MQYNEQVQTMIEQQQWQARALQDMTLQSITANNIPEQLNAVKNIGADIASMINSWGK